MSTLIRIVAVSVALCAVPQILAAQSKWSASVAAGYVDQEAIGGTPTVAVDVARLLRPRQFLGVRAGFFGKEDGAGSSRDTYYAVFFARTRFRTDGRTPFAEVAGGRYSFEGESLAGWNVGLGYSIPLSAFSTNRSFEITGRYHSVERPAFGPLPDFKELHVAFRYEF